MTGRPPAAVFVNALTKTYGQVEAVRSIDLEVHAGETFGFLGPNGAGKPVKELRLSSRAVSVGGA